MSAEDQRLLMVSTSERCRGWVIAKTGFDADDVLQTSLLKGFQAINKQGEGIENAQAFFIKILQREISSLFRTRIRGRLHIEIGLLCEYLKDSEKRPDQILLEKEERQCLVKTMSQLPARGREVLERFYLHDEPPEQIQDEMGFAKKASFKLAKTRAKKKLGEIQRANNARDTLRSVAKAA